MNNVPFRFYSFFVCSLLFLNSCNILGTTGESSAQPQFDTPFSFDIEDLSYVKNEISKDNSTYEKAYNNLLIEANKALNSYGYSVVTKQGSAPNGDKHEYVSRGRYWWPNPETEDGLPYIKRDGKTNPEIYQFDRIPLSNLSSDIRALSTIYYITKDEKYAKKAISLLKQWFINKETKMNPNLRFAQGIPGVATGRPAGIIDGIDFARIVNFFPILNKSKHWTRNINHNLKQWFKLYYRWLQEHEYGIAERKSPNNHGSWYDVQIATYAYFLGDSQKLDEIANRLKEKRIPEQINPSGKQPYEANRNNSLDYSLYNLRALTMLASLAHKSSETFIASQHNESALLWKFSSANSGSIEDAVQYLVPHLTSVKTWNFQQSSEFIPCTAIPVLKRAYDFSQKDIYRNTYQSILKNNRSCQESYLILLYPIHK